MRSIVSVLIRCRVIDVLANADWHKRFIHLAVLLIVVAVCSTSQAADGSTEILDCPLRDIPFSVDSPFLDILLNDDAKAVVAESLPGFFEKVPPFFMKTEAPAFGAIMTLKSVLGMSKAPMDGLPKINASLAEIPVTDEDRRNRCARYDNQVPEIESAGSRPHLLVFTKVNGFDHGDSTTAATEAIKSLAQANGWVVSTTNKAGVFNADTLPNFAAVIWNNVSGDVLTLTQRDAFKNYLENGGGFVGIHGSGGDAVYFWPWYAESVLGAQFIGHPMQPQFQEAVMNIEADAGAIAAGLPENWKMSEEWYSFAESPRVSGARVIATLDESTYSLVGFGGADIRMGDDHPIAWTRCVSAGRSFYTAVGHLSESYDDANYLRLLEQGIAWAMDSLDSECR